MNQYSEAHPPTEVTPFPPGSRLSFRRNSSSFLRTTYYLLLTTYYLLLTTYYLLLTALLARGGGVCPPTHPIVVVSCFSRECVGIVGVASAGNVHLVCSRPADLGMCSQVQPPRGTGGHHTELASLRPDLVGECAAKCSRPMPSLVLVLRRSPCITWRLNPDH